MIITDADGVIRFANAEVERLFDYPKGALIGGSIELLVPQPLRDRHATFRRRFLANPEKRPMGSVCGLTGRRRDGIELHLEIELTPLWTHGVLMILAVVADTSERRAAENALALRATELERANERLAQFAFVASHDLQEPLRKIAAFSKFLDEAIACGNPVDIARANKVIRTSALHARELVDDLLVLSSTINSTLQLQIIDLREAIEIALRELSEAIIETNTIITIELPRVAINVDRSSFGRLIQNIVSNAIKYRKPGGGARIKITAAPVDGSAIRLAIADDGIGFEEKYAQTIFEAFKRLHSSADYPGTGIGLAICKAIVDRHGWRVSVKSQPSEGATFLFIIPISSPEAAESEP
jgi:PAS domain S-box-containing protein